MELMVEAGLKDWRFGEIVVQVVLFMELNNETFHPKDKFIGLLQQHCKMFLWSPSQFLFLCLDVNLTVL